MGNLAAARANWKKALEIGNDDGLLFRISTLLPVVASSIEEMTEARRDLDNNLEKISDKECCLNDPYVEVGASNFNFLS